MILQDGFYNQRQILPPAVVRRTLTPRYREVFNALYCWASTVISERRNAPRP